MTINEDSTSDGLITTGLYNTLQVSNSKIHRNSISVFVLFENLQRTCINLLRAKITKWSNTLKQFADELFECV